MKHKVDPIPTGYHTVTPYIIVRGAVKALEFYKEAFGAKEMFRMQLPNGRITHAEMKIGDSPVMLKKEMPATSCHCQSPATLGGSPVFLYLYIENVDAFAVRALAAGAKIISPLQDHFYGDRSCGLMDLFGHIWHVSTHVEDVPPEELRISAEAFTKQPQK